MDETRAAWMAGFEAGRAGIGGRDCPHDDEWHRVAWLLGRRAAERGSAEAPAATVLSRPAVMLQDAD